MAVFSSTQKYSRVLGRIQIEARDVGRFCFKLRIIAGHVAFEAVWFQTACCQTRCTASLLTPSAVARLAANSVRRSIAGFSPRG